MMGGWMLDFGDALKPKGFEISLVADSLEAMTSANSGSWKRLKTWREQINDGSKTWHDYYLYRCERLYTETMEYAKLDDVFHTMTMIMPLLVISRGERQTYITIK